MRLAQRAWEDQWAKFEPVRMLLASSTIVARQPKTPMLKIEYPKNSLFRPDKWAPATPGDW